MLINNTEALKNWLVVVLTPLCDADSSALAPHVLALLNKDKPEEELKRVMIEQLDVFLERFNNTEEFTITPQRTSALQMNTATKETANNDVTITGVEISSDDVNNEHLIKISTEEEQIYTQIQNQQPSTIIVKKTKEQQKKELFDIELELFAQEQKGNDTTAIQKRLEKLKHNLGIVSLHQQGIFKAGPPWEEILLLRPHIPSYSEDSTRVDRRPKSVIVTGFKIHLSNTF